MAHAVFVSHSPRVSGAEVVMLDLVEYAVSQGWDVTVLCPRGDVVDRLPASVRWREIPRIALAGETGIRRVLAFTAMMRRWVVAAASMRTHTASADSVIINSTHALPAWSLTGRRQRATWLVHDVIDSRKRKIYARMARYAISRAIAVSSRCATSVRAIGIPTVEMPLGVDIPDDVAPRGVSSPPTVGMLAVLTRWKAQDLVIAAVAELPGVRLELAGEAFAGDETYVGELRRLITRLGCADRVELIGRVPRDSVLRKWDVVVCASRQAENSPLAVLEAMARCVPVVVSVSGGGHVPADSVWTVPDDDAAALTAAIGAAITDNAERTERTERAREFVANTHNRQTAVPTMFDVLTDRQSAVIPAAR